MIVEVTEAEGPAAQRLEVDGLFVSAVEVGEFEGYSIFGVAAGIDPFGPGGIVTLAPQAGVLGQCLLVHVPLEGLPTSTSPRVPLILAEVSEGQRGHLHPWVEEATSEEVVFFEDGGRLPSLAAAREHAAELAAQIRGGFASAASDGDGIRPSAAPKGRGRGRGRGRSAASGRGMGEQSALLDALARMEERLVALEGRGGPAPLQGGEGSVRPSAAAASSPAYVQSAKIAPSTFMQQRGGYGGGGSCWSLNLATEPRPALPAWCIRFFGSPGCRLGMSENHQGRRAGV